MNSIQQMLSLGLYMLIDQVQTSLWCDYFNKKTEQFNFFIQHIFTSGLKYHNTFTFINNWLYIYCLLQSCFFFISFICFSFTCILLKNILKKTKKSQVRINSKFTHWCDSNSKELSVGVIKVDHYRKDNE